MLTPIDVQSKSFKSGMGYSKADVDSFLTNLYADYETLYRENMELKKIKCPSCGGELNIPEDSDEMKCSFCGSKVIIDDKATEVRRIKSRN